MRVRNKKEGYEHHETVCPSDKLSFNVLFVAVSNTEFQRLLMNRTCTTLLNGSIKTNEELDATKKEVVAHFKTLLQHLPWT